MNPSAREGTDAGAPNVWEAAVVSEAPLFRMGIRTVLKGCARVRLRTEAEDLRQIIRESIPPNLVILEAAPGRGDVLDGLLRLRDAWPSICPLAFTPSLDVEFAERCLRLGVRGYLHRSAPATEVREAIEQLRAGELYVSARISCGLIQRYMQPPRERVESTDLSCLSAREYQVWQLLGAGDSCGDVARKLGISPKTVDAHREHIRKKLGIATSGDLARLARENLAPD